MTILTAQALTARRLAEALEARDHALRELVGLVDPEDQLSTWARAGLIAEALEPFSGTPYRILTHTRRPKSDTDRCLFALCEAECPGSQRRIFDLLRELGL